MAKFKNFYSDPLRQVKRNMANVLGLTHLAYNIWRDEKGNHFIWSNKKSHFVKYAGKENEI